MTEAEKVAEEMLKAYVEWEPPCQVDVSNPVRALGLVRAAFFAGWKAAAVRDILRAKEADKEAS